MKIVFLWVLYPLIRPFYLISVILNTLLLAVIILTIAPFDKRGNLVHYIGKLWALFNICLSGARVTVRGKRSIVKSRNYILMSNHQSLFDVWVLIAKMPLQLRWIIKSEIRRIPIFGYALERMGHIFVDRKTQKSAFVSLNAAAERIREGVSVVVFPEGTRSEDGHLRKFQGGGFVLANMAGVPILPVTINGSRFVLPKGTLALMPARIEIVVGDLIDPGSFSHKGKGALLNAVKSVIEKNLDLTYGKLT